MMKKNTQSFWKSLSFFIFLSSALISCQSSPKYTLEDSRFMGKMGVNDTLKVINEVHYCEEGPMTESYYFYYPNQSKDMECRFQMEYGWKNWKVAEQGIIREETYKVSPKAIKQFLKFERDVINKDTGNEGGCSTYEFFDIILKNDTANSNHHSCQYEGFGKVIIELRKNIISEEK